MQKQRDNSTTLKQCTDYKMLRNKNIQLIRQAKRKYFSDSVKNSKDSKTIWNHLRAVNNKKQKKKQKKKKKKKKCIEEFPQRSNYK